MENPTPNQSLNQPETARHSHLPVLLVLLAILLIGSIGWWLFGNNQASTNTPANSDQTSSVPEVNNESDLEKAGEFLSESEIDQQLDTGELDEALD